MPQCERSKKEVTLGRFRVFSPPPYVITPPVPSSRPNSVSGNNFSFPHLLFLSELALRPRTSISSYRLFLLVHDHIDTVVRCHVVLDLCLLF